MCINILFHVRIQAKQNKLKLKMNSCNISTHLLLFVQEDDFVARDDFEDADQLRIGNDGIFMLTFFSKNLFSVSALDLWTVFFLKESTDFHFHRPVLS